jgi:hypothetical protein
MTQHDENPEALAAFISRKAEIDTILQRLTALSDNHFNAAPEEVNWGHVGLLDYYLKLLRQMSDVAFHEGEHAT